MPHIYSKLARLMYKIDYFRPFLLIFWALSPFWSAAQTTSQTSFGKNRVQYHHQFDDWLLYETNSFTTYWYGDARNVAQAALQTAELDFPMVQQLLEHQRESPRSARGLTFYWQVLAPDYLPSESPRSRQI
jgi:hypothetical protein